MGFLSSLASGAGGGLVSGLLGMAGAQQSDVRSLDINRKLMSRQNELNKDYAEWSAKRLPSLEREGMEAAGFNPLLAFSHGTGDQGHVSIPSYSSANRLQQVGDNALQGLIAGMQSADRRASIDVSRDRLSLDRANSTLKLLNDTMRNALEMKGLTLRNAMLDKDLQTYDARFKRQSRFYSAFAGIKDSIKDLFVGSRDTTINVLNKLYHGGFDFASDAKSFGLEHRVQHLTPDGRIEDIYFK